MLKTDVLILGGGLVGSSLGVALDAHGLSSVIVDIADPDTILAADFDGRASAIASAPWRMLTALGVTPALAAVANPIEGIRVSDGLEPGALDFAADPDDVALGHMVENRHLRRALYEAAQRAGSCDVRMNTRATDVQRGPAGVTATLSDGTTVSAPLLIAAEGRNSPTREAAHLAVARWRYEHVAMVSTFHHARPHANIAYEIFYPAGPFALLPLVDDAEGHRSAIVWSVHEKDAPGFMKLSDRGWLAEAEKAMGGFLGELSGLTKRMSYPIGFHHAATITAERLALVGDAAHGIHPIAGQGVNVGFRDVATLVEVLVEGRRTGMDLGDPELLKRYERWRSLDTFMVALATDGLTRLFGIPGRTANAVRRAGLSAVQRLPMLKDRFMAEARGESGAVPKLLNGALV